MTRTNLCLVIVIVACGASGGCGAKPDATVQGTVTIDGELANRGTVVFHPVKEGPPAYGTVHENGTYSLRVGQGDLEEVDGGKLRSGDYIVTVVVNMPPLGKETVGGAAGPPVPGPRLTAGKYAETATSDLRFTVKPGLNVVPLELEGAAAEEAREEAAEAKPKEDEAKEDEQPKEEDQAKEGGQAADHGDGGAKPAGDAAAEGAKDTTAAPGAQPPADSAPPANEPQEPRP